MVSPASSVNHRAPSGPATIPVGWSIAVLWYWDTVPPVVMLPIELLVWLVNHRFPSGPHAMPSGPLIPVPGEIGHTVPGGPGRQRSGHHDQGEERAVASTAPTATRQPGRDRCRRPSGEGPPPRSVGSAPRSAHGQYLHLRLSISMVAWRYRRVNKSPTGGSGSIGCLAPAERPAGGVPDHGPGADLWREPQRRDLIDASRRCGRVPHPPSAVRGGYAAPCAGNHAGSTDSSTGVIYVGRARERAPICSFGGRPPPVSCRVVNVALHHREGRLRRWPPPR